MVSEFIITNKLYLQLNNYFNLGIQTPRVSVVDGSSLPSPRLITSTVHRDFDRPDFQLSVLLMSWGQFIDHDLTLAAGPRGMCNRVTLKIILYK